MKLLVIRWDPEDGMWLVLDADSREVITRFDHLADAGWFLQQKHAEAAS